VYDSIRKFLQFQLTVNIVALLLVFISACAGALTPLNAVQMLWTNLIMDTMGALALATEPPDHSMLERKPYIRDASLISRPMWRNILVQAVFQVALLLILLFKGAELFGVPDGEHCRRWSVAHSSLDLKWDTQTMQKDSQAGTTSCLDFYQLCPRVNTFNGECYYETYVTDLTNNNVFRFSDLNNFAEECLSCDKYDYKLGSIIFNTFIWCQIFNEYTARHLFNEWNFLLGIGNNITFIVITIFTIGSQIFLIEVGGDFVRTEHLTVAQWFICMALGAIGLILGVIMRFIPVEEDPAAFFDNSVSLKTSSVARDSTERGNVEMVIKV
jgi:magnesium-transporting ATPase (P-type)